MSGILKLISFVVFLAAFVIPLIIDTMRMEDTCNGNWLTAYKPVGCKFTAIAVIFAIMLYAISYL